jgi:hypothetical protein
MIIHLDSGYFNAGVIVKDDRVVIAAPILKYMVGWSDVQVIAYAIRKGWDFDANYHDNGE